jgi:hypothetical protein
MNDLEEHYQSSHDYVAYLMSCLEQYMFSLHDFFY